MGEEPLYDSGPDTTPVFVSSAPDEPSTDIVEPVAASALAIGRAKRRRRVPRRTLDIVGVLVLAVAVFVIVIALKSSSHPARSTHPVTTPTTTGTVSTARGWTTSDLHVVGGPTLAGGRVLVVGLAPDKTLTLEAVNPADGSVVWQVPFSASAVSSGVLLAPLVSGNVVLDLAPIAGPTSAVVAIEGIDIATGKALWNAPSVATVTDPPALCTAQALFCVDEAGSGGTGTLVLLSPTTGLVMGTVPGPARQMAPDLYETGTTPPAFEQVSGAGRPAWTAQVSTLFGGTQYSPQYGWNLSQVGSIDVGTVGVAPNGTTEPLDAFKTIGISVADGTVQWSTPGSYQCFDVLGLPAPFVCRYTGQGTFTGGVLSTSGVTLTLEGLNPANGAILWSHAVANTQALTTGNGVPIADLNHIVVTLASGTPVLVNLTTGTTSAVPVGETMWCGQSQLVSVNAPPVALAGGKRVGTTLFGPCTATGAAATGTPAHAVASIGVWVDGLFIWATPTGLSASALPH
ncbi:MAG: outer membrane protein assembly factor BamB family protein [Acidimicrobiales bacterium]